MTLRRMNTMTNKRSIFKKSIILLSSLTLVLCSCNSTENESESSSSNGYTSSSYSEEYSSREEEISSEEEEIVKKAVSMFETEEVNDYVTEFLSLPKTAPDDSDVYSLLMQSLGSDLYGKGYKVFPGYAVIDPEKNTLVPGLAYTVYEPFVLDDGSSEPTGFYSCGFYQLVFSASEMCLNEDVIIQGVPVIPESGTIDEGNYIISTQCDVDPFGGIYLDKYFTYGMVNDYTVGIEIKENVRSNWNENFDIYDFNKAEYVYRSDFDYKSTSAIGLYEDEYSAYCVARNAFEEIVRIQNENHLDLSNSVMVIFSEDVINEYLMEHQLETLNQYIIEQLNGIELEDHEYVMITKESVSIQNTQEYIDEKSEERMVNGIIAAITSSLMIAGAVVATVFTCGAASSAVPIVITATFATFTSIYATSNLIEAGQDIYYGATDDIYSDSLNPALAAFKLAFGDSRETEIAYHAWGISSSILTSLPSLVINIGNAASAASIAAANLGRSVALAVTRVVVVSLLKIVVPIGVSVVVSQGVTHLVTEATGKEYYGKLAGVISGIAAAFAVSVGFNVLDKELGLSVDKSMYKEYQRVRTMQKIVKSFEKNYTGDEENYIKGNYGEVRSELDLTRDGWKKVSVNDVNDIKVKSPQGIDGIYKKGDSYVVVESKFNTSPLGTTKTDGKEMSELWILKRTSAAFGGNEAEYNAFCEAYLNHDVISVVHRIDPAADFAGTFYLLNTEADYTGLSASSINELLTLMAAV